MSAAKQYIKDDIFIFERKTTTLVAKYTKIIFRFPYRYVLSIIWITCFIFWMGSWVHFIYSTQRMSNMAFIENLFDLAYGCPLFYCCLVFLIKFDDFMKLVHKLESFEQFNDPKDVEQFDRFGLFCISLIFKLFIVGFFFISGLFCAEIFIVGDDNRVVRSLWLPWNGYHVIYTLSIAAVIILLCLGTLIHLLITALYAACSETIIFRIQCLQSLLSKIDFNNQSAVKEQLKTCIAFQIRIIQLHRENNSYWGIMINTSNFYYVFTMGVSAVMFLVKPSLEEPLVCAFLGTNAFMQHFIGQRLIDYSSSLVDVAYNLNWYDGGISYQKELLIFITKTQNPLKNEFNVFGELSHNSFSRMLAKTYSFLNLLHNVYTSKS